VSEGGPIAYSTGIAEVALPIEFKLRNIEATEKAQKRAMETAGKRGERPEDIGACASPLLGRWLPAWCGGASMPCGGWVLAGCKTGTLTQYTQTNNL